MKKIIPICLWANMLIGQLNAQSLTPQVVATAGGYQSGANASISFTIGETNITTLTTSTYMLTQGFQQPVELHLLNVKAFLQGYYAGAGLMKEVLYNQGEYTAPSDVTDSVTIELHHTIAPYTIAFQAKTIIKQNGSVSIKGMGAMGQSYYLVLKHRNSIQTWSAMPITISEITNYDFSTSANKAYGDNMIEVEPNVFACYSGDINQDENVDLLDAASIETDINAFQYGYFATDINGDGNVDLLDAPVVETNINQFVFSSHP